MKRLAALTMAAVLLAATAAPTSAFGGHIAIATSDWTSPDGHAFVGIQADGQWATPSGSGYCSVWQLKAVVAPNEWVYWVWVYQNGCSGQPLNFTSVGHGQDHLRAAANQFLHLFDHRWHRAVKACDGLRKKCRFRSFFVRFRGLTRHRQIFEVGSRERRRFFPPAFRRQIKIGGADQLPDSTALMRFLNARPNFVQFLRQRFRLVENDPRVWKEPENAAVRARHWSVELPSRKNSSA